MLSTETVATRKLECRRAQMAAVISISSIIRPPKTEPMVLASDGTAKYEVSVADSLTVLLGILFSLIVKLFIGMVSAANQRGRRDVLEPHRITVML